MQNWLKTILMMVAALLELTMMVGQVHQDAVSIAVLCLKLFPSSKGRDRMLTTRRLRALVRRKDWRYQLQILLGKDCARVAISPCLKLQMTCSNYPLASLVQVDDVFDYDNHIHDRMRRYIARTPFFSS